MNKLCHPIWWAVLLDLITVLNEGARESPPVCSATLVTLRRRALPSPPLPRPASRQTPCLFQSPSPRRSLSPTLTHTAAVAAAAISHVHLSLLPPSFLLPSVPRRGVPPSAPPPLAESAETSAGSPEHFTSSSAVSANIIVIYKHFIAAL